MIKVFIPRYRTVEEELGRSHTVFEIDVYVSGRHHKLDKRYRAFHSLHKQLKKILLTPVFPPKRVRNWNQKILEQRRQGLEHYVQALVRVSPIPKPLLAFLEVPIQTEIETYSIPHKDDWRTAPLMHLPILSFTKDPYLDSSGTADCFPDTVVKGVTQGIYASLDEGSVV